MSSNAVIDWTSWTFHVFSNYMTHRNSCHTLSCWMVYLQYEFFHGPSKHCYLRVYTIWTAERFFISMNYFMCLQMLWLAELLFTLWAAEWFFISINYFMSLHSCLRICSHTLNSWMVFHQYEFSHVSSNAVMGCVEQLNSFLSV